MFRMFCMLSTGDCLRSSDRALAPTCVCVSHIQSCVPTRLYSCTESAMSCVAAIQGGLWKQSLHDHGGVKPNCRRSFATRVVTFDSTFFRLFFSLAVFKHRHFPTNGWFTGSFSHITLLGKRDVQIRFLPYQPWI